MRVESFGYLRVDPSEAELVNGVRDGIMMSFRVFPGDGL